MKEDDFAECVFSMLLLKNGETISIGRTEKSTIDTSILEEVFQIANYPDCETKRNLSILLRMSHKTIQIWFQNRRRYIKNCQKKRTALKNKNCFITHGENYKINSDGNLIVQTPIPPRELLRIYCKKYNIW